MQALKAGCLLLAIAFAIDLAALFIQGFGSTSDLTDYRHGELLTRAASAMAVLSVVLFVRVVPPQHGRLVRQAALIFWALIAASAIFEGFVWATRWLDFAFGVWPSLAFLAMWAALGWGVGLRPVGSRVAGLAAAVAATACIVLTIAGLALDWDSEGFGSGGKLFHLAALLALCAVAVSLGVQRRSSSVTEPSLR